MKFVYVFTEEDREKLIIKGLREISTCTLGSKKAWVFDNSIETIMCFTKEDKKNFLFTDMVYFV